MHKEDERSVVRRPPPGHVHPVALLSHLRWMSALVVVLSHVEMNLLNKGPAVSPISDSKIDDIVSKPLFGLYGYGHAAVVVFFVLSGFLVGGKLVQLARSEGVQQEWKKFLIDRFSRIFVVLWPAILLTLIVFLALSRFVPDAPFVRDGCWSSHLVPPIASDQHFVRWLAGAFLLNDLVVPTLVTNGPLWSLSYEWTYYVVGLAVVLFIRRIVSPMSIILMLYATVLFVLAVVWQPDLVASGACWASGLVARVAFERSVLRGSVSRVAGVVAIVGILILERWRLLPDPVLGFAVAFTVAHSAWQNWTWASRTGERLADFSYSLYLTHFPILLICMGLLYRAHLIPPRHPMDAVGIILVFAVTALILVFARLFAVLTENRTRQVRDLLMQILRPDREGAQVAVGPRVEEQFPTAAK